MSIKNIKKPIKIMVFGCFDGVHPGHVHFFNQAKKLTPNSFLVVSVARDKNVSRIKKKLPLFNEKQRLALVRRERVVDRAVLSGLNNHIAHIVLERPSIIALGYDQKAYVRNLKRDLSQRGLDVKIVRLKPYRKNIYKSSLINKRRGV